MTATLDDCVRRVLDLPEVPPAWREGFDDSVRSHAITPRPDPPAIADILRWLDAGDDATATLAAAAERVAADELHALLFWHLFRRWVLAGPAAIEDALQWPRGTSPPLLTLYALLCLAGVPRGRQALEARRLAPDVVHVSLSDVARRLHACRRAHGVYGIANPRWLGRHLQGRLVELGRLQYEVGALRDKIPHPHHACAFAPPTTRVEPTTPVWWIHIPAGDPLTPAAVDASLAQARALLPAAFPDHPATLFACCSWMLDEQLREYLAPAANVLHFQQRFRVLAAWPDAGELARFLRCSDPHAPLTTLHRADLAHRAAGRAWRVALGVLPL